MENTTTPTPHEGVTVRMAGKDWIVPPLNFRQLKELLPRIKSVQAGDFTPEFLEAMGRVIHASLSRNYPELTPETVEDMLDMSNFTPVFNAVMQVSGLASVKGVMAGQTT